VALLSFAATLFLVYNFFFPGMRDINVWDESVYVNTGRNLAEGQLPSFARNPLIGLIYAVTYLPFANSPFWLVQSVAFGRLVLFGLMWLSCFLIATRLSDWIPPYSVAGLLLVFPVTLEILLNPSDALFAAMSGFAFWQLLAFCQTRAGRHLAWASFFCGLAALSRNDGLVLFGIFVALAALIIGRTRWQAFWLAAIAGPFAALVGGYLLLYGAVTGDFSLRTEERAYTAFQQGHAIDYRPDPTCDQKPLKCAVQQAAQLYGTAEENDFSIFNAIRRNPGAYLSRVSKQVRALPELVYDMLGPRTAFLMFILFARGALELIRRRAWLLAALLAIWPAFLGVYFLTFFRIGYLRMPYYLLYVVAAIGAVSFLADARQQRPARVWTGLLAAATVAGMLTDTRALYFTTGLLLAALAMVRWLPDPDDSRAPYAAGLIALLCVGLILRPTLDPPVRRDLAAGEEEQALLTAYAVLPPGSLVAAGAPGWVSAARLEYFDLNGPEFGELESGEQVYALLKAQGVEAVYVDSALSNANDHIWLLMEPDLDRWYDTAYSGREGSIRLLLLK
jgi:hypothetical protein